LGGVNVFGATRKSLATLERSPPLKWSRQRMTSFIARWSFPIVTLSALLLSDCGFAAAFENQPEGRGALLLCGGGNPIGSQLNHWQQNPISKRFVELAGGPGGECVIVQVPHSQAQKDTRPLDERVASRPEPAAAAALGLKKVTALRLTDREAANSETYVAPLRSASAVWITGGDLNVLVREALGSRLQRELQAVVDRGGVVGGESAGAVILTSQITKNIKGTPQGAAPDVDLYTGFGLIDGIVVVAHLLRMNWQENLVPVISAHPTLIGVGIDEGAAVVVQNGVLEAIGTDKVAIYDNGNYNGKRYFFLADGERFDVKARRKLSRGNKTP
jgi:cyanophycinase